MFSIKNAGIAQICIPLHQGRHTENLPLFSKSFTGKNMVILVARAWYLLHVFMLDQLAAMMKLYIPYQT